MHTLQQLIAHALRLPAERISASTAMKLTPEWDSLKHMEIILAVEQHFGIELTGDEIAEMTSVKKIDEILKQRGLCS